MGSAPLAPFVVERLQERMPDAMVSNNYGMTEAGSAYCIMPKGEAVRRPGSVGRIAPPAEVRIVGADEKPLAPDEVGEVRLHLPGRHREYFDDPEATAETWRDGWLVTGDLGRLDDDGYLYIVGRSKDVIIRGGNNIHAADVEHVLVQHADVAEVAVVGSAHPVLGEDVVAFVVLHPGADVDGDALRAYALAQLADYKVPRQYRFIDGLPRNATGKVVKAELRAWPTWHPEQLPVSISRALFVPLVLVACLLGGPLGARGPGGWGRTRRAGVSPRASRRLPRPDRRWPQRARRAGPDGHRGAGRFRPPVEWPAPGRPRTSSTSMGRPSCAAARSRRPTWRRRRGGPLCGPVGRRTAHPGRPARSSSCSGRCGSWSHAEVSGRPPRGWAPFRRRALYRTLKFVVLVGIGWLIVRSLPDVARYLRMRSL